MLEHSPWVLTLIAGCLGGIVGANLGRRTRWPWAMPALAGAAGFLTGTAGLWLVFAGLAQAWQGGGWLGVSIILGVLLALTLALRWLDDRCPSNRSVSSYCQRRDARAAQGR